MDANSSSAAIATASVETSCSLESSPPPSLPSLIDKLRQELRLRHYADRTERAFVEWVHRFCAWFDGRPLETLGEPEVRAFLADLAGRPDVAVTTRNQARQAVLMFFHYVLGKRLDCSDGLGRAQKDGSEGPPVLSPMELQRLLAAVEPAYALPVALIHGCGLRLSEVLALRVRDLDLGPGIVHVRETRSSKEPRLVPLPQALRAPLQKHLDGLRRRHETDLLKSAGFAQLPEEVRVQMPQATRALGWQWLFQAGRLQRDPVTEEGRRPPLHEAVLQRALTTAARAAGIAVPVNAQTLRHSAAMHALQASEAALAA